MEDDVAPDVHTAEGDRLRHGPEHLAAGRGDRESPDGLPEGGRGVVVAGSRLGADVAGDVRRIGRGSEAQDFSVEADGNVDLIFAGEKEEGVALAAELVVLLDGVDLVDLGPNLGRRGRGREDGDVRAEVGSFCLAGGLCGGCCKEEGDQQLSTGQNLHVVLR